MVESYVPYFLDQSILAERTCAACTVARRSQLNYRSCRCVPANATHSSGRVCWPACVRPLLTDDCENALLIQGGCKKGVRFAPSTSFGCPHLTPDHRRPVRWAPCSLC